MFWQRVRKALLTSMVVLAMAASSGRGDENIPAPAHPAPHPAPAPACAPAAACPTRKITVEECVPEYYKTTRTVYKTQQVQEEYTDWKCEKVPETRTRTVPCEDIRCRTTCVTVPCVETRTCYEKCYTTRQVTCVKRRCVDQGHYECRQVECGPSFRDRMSHLCSHRDCNGCREEPCKRYETKKVWVPCKQWIEEPYTKCERVCEYKPYTKQVQTCKKEYRTEQYKVQTYKCVPKCHTETYTVCVEKRTPVKAVRTVCKSVPVQEEVTACRMVKKCVEKEVPCEPPCQPACQPACEPACKPCKRGLFRH
jgi:hypothetical protein